MTALLGAIVTSASGAAVGFVIAWAMNRFSRLRARMHHTRRFFAGIDVLINCEAPKEVLDFLSEIAGYIQDRELAIAISTLAVDGEQEPENDFFEMLPEHERLVYAQTMFAFGMSISYLAGKSGRKFRTRLIDHMLDRRTVVYETRKVQDFVSERHALCAA